MKILITMLLFASFSLAQAERKSVCVDLEHSAFPDEVRHYSVYNFVQSHDQSKIALYQNFESNKLALFKLWDSQTGKLLHSKTVKNFEEMSHQTSLHFSRDDSIVYLKGMTNGIPFWNLTYNNKLVMSACETGMGAADVQFSHDMKISYSTSVDGSRSLCRTRKKEGLFTANYLSREFIFDKQKKYLYAAFILKDEESHQRVAKLLGKSGRQYASLYRSPVIKQRFAPPKPDNALATLMLGTPPNFRLLVAKNLDAELSFGLWEYQHHQDSPKKIYQYTYRIPELVSEKKPLVSYSRIHKSNDSKRAAFLSPSGVLAVFNIQSGKLLWKADLRQRHGLSDQASFSFEYRKDKPLTEDSLVVVQDSPEALLFFSWETGQERELKIPDGFMSSFYKHHGEYLLLKESPSKDRRFSGRMLLLNWRTGQRQIISLPPGFTASGTLLPNSTQLMFESRPDYSKANLEAKTPYAIFLYDWKTGKSKIHEIPLKEDDYYYSNYFSLAHGHHLLIYNIESDKEKNEVIGLYDISTQQYRTLKEEIFLSHGVGLDHKDDSVLETMSYDIQKSVSTFCRMDLEHNH